MAFVQDGSTPLSAAASSGHDAVVLLLLESKAAADTTNKVSEVNRAPSRRVTSGLRCMDDAHMDPDHSSLGFKR